MVGEAGACVLPHRRRVTDHLLTFRVSGHANDVRDLGNGIREAVQAAQRQGQHEGVTFEGPTIEPIIDTRAVGFVAPPPRDPRKPSRY